MSLEAMLFSKAPKELIDVGDQPPEYGIPQVIPYLDSITYSSGTHLWVVPEGVDYITILALGGAGSGDNGNKGDGGGGGGHGGPAVLVRCLRVTPGDQILSVVGLGGRGPVAYGADSGSGRVRAISGTASQVSLNGTRIITANGALGGIAYSLGAFEPLSTGTVNLTGLTYLNYLITSGGHGGAGYNGGGGGGGAASFLGNGGRGSTARDAIVGTVYLVGTNGGLYAGGGGSAAYGPHYGGNGAGRGGLGQNDATGGGGGGSNILLPPYLPRNGSDGNGLRTYGSRGGNGAWPGGGGGGSYDESTGLTSMGANRCIRIVWGSLLDIYNG